MLNEKLKQAYFKCYNEILNNKELLQDMQDYTEILEGIIPTPTEEEFREYLYKKYKDNMVQRIITAYTIDKEDNFVSNFVTYMNYLLITPGEETQTIQACYLRLQSEIEAIKNNEEF